MQMLQVYELHPCHGRRTGATTDSQMAPTQAKGKRLELWPDESHAYGLSPPTSGSELQGFLVTCIVFVDVQLYF